MSRLNIKIGDYCLAIAIGDGMLSFSGTESITTIINTLQGAVISTGPEG
jgi:hypothetical protein